MQPVVWSSPASFKPDLQGWLLPSGFSGIKSLNALRRRTCCLLITEVLQELWGEGWFMHIYKTTWSDHHPCWLGDVRRSHIAVWWFIFSSERFTWSREPVGLKYFGARASHLSPLWNVLPAGRYIRTKVAREQTSASDLISFSLCRKEDCLLFAPAGRQRLVCAAVCRWAGRGMCDVQIGRCSQYSLDCTLYCRWKWHQIWCNRRFFQSCTIAGSRDEDQGTLTNWFQVTKCAQATRNSIRYLHAHHRNRPDRDWRFLICFISRLICLS